MHWQQRTHAASDAALARLQRPTIGVCTHITHNTSLGANQRHTQGTNMMVEVPTHHIKVSQMSGAARQWE